MRQSRTITIPGFARSALLSVRHEGTRATFKHRTVVFVGLFWALKEPTPEMPTVQELIATHLLCERLCERADGGHHLGIANMSSWRRRTPFGSTHLTIRPTKVAMWGQELAN